MRTALCTGAKGFVGRHMKAALEDQGYHVLGVDLVDGHDARQFFRLDDRRFDLVVHCAAVVGGRTMIDGEPLRLAVADLQLDAGLFEWAMRTRPGRIVAFSSSAAYPVARQREGHCGTLSESTIWKHPAAVGIPDQTYGWVKLTLERLAAEANAEGIRTHVFRPFSGYGGDQADDYPFPAIVKRACQYALSNGAPPVFATGSMASEAAARAAGAISPFHVWGHPGSARDWVHIDDVIGCVLAHIEADVIGPVNICTGVATTFEQLATMALAAVGCSAPIIGDTSKPTGVFWRVGDPTLMQQVYTPKVTLAEGIRRAVEELSQ